MEWPGCSLRQPILPHTACSRPHRSRCMYQPRKQHTQWHPHPSLRQHRMACMEWLSCSLRQPILPHTVCRSRCPESCSCQEHTRKRPLHSSHRGSPRYRCTSTPPHHRSTLRRWRKAGFRTRSHCSPADSSCSTPHHQCKPYPGSQSRQPLQTDNRSQCSSPARRKPQRPPAGSRHRLRLPSQPGKRTGTNQHLRWCQSMTRCRYHYASMAA